MAKAKEQIDWATVSITKSDMKGIFNISLATMNRLIDTDSTFPKKDADGRFNLLQLIQYFKNAGGKKSDSSMTEAKLKLVKMQAKRIALQIRERQLELVEIAFANDQIQKILQELKSNLEKLPREISIKTEGLSKNEIEIITKQIIADTVEKWMDKKINV